MSSLCLNKIADVRRRVVVGITIIISGMTRP